MIDHRQYNKKNIALITLNSGEIIFRTTMGHFYPMTQDLSGQEGVALILNNDGTVSKSRVQNDKKLVPDSIADLIVNNSFEVYKSKYESFGETRLLLERSAPADFVSMFCAFPEVNNFYIARIVP